MSHPSRSSTSRWLLVVEDNPDDERLATKIFTGEGRQEKMIIARDGEEALRVLRESEPPEIVFLDLKLPRLSGMEVMMAIKDDDRLRVVPIVVLSSSDEKSDRVACYELGCNAFVQKSVSYEEYRDNLKTILSFWLDINLSAIA